MSGHSKWKTIKNKKGKEDAKRGVIFTKLARYIMVAARDGGADPEYNASLKAAIDKAKAENMPNDNIDRAIKKGAGGLDGQNYENIIYEGYGPGGVAVLVQCLTDNRNRTAADVRHAFDASGGNLGQNGSVSFMFDHKGVIWIPAEGLDEESVMMEALDAGAEDFSKEVDVFEVLTSVTAFNDVRNRLSANYKFEKADLDYIPQNYSEVSDPAHQKALFKFLDNLEDNDDVQEIYHNWDIPEDLDF